MRLPDRLSVFWTKFVAVAVVILAVTVLPIPIDARQPFPPSVQQAIAQLTGGIIPFTILRMIPDGYLNFGDTSGANGYGLRDNNGTIQFKQENGSWVSLPASGTFPTGASYWTRVAEADLSNETALGSLGTGLIRNTATSGVPVIYAGSACTNQLMSSLSADGTAGCASVNLGSMVTSTLNVANGGTGLTAGVSGGILGYTATGTLASSAALGASQVILGGGAGATPTALGSLGTTVQVLHGNAAGAPTWGSVGLTTDVTGILPSANGGTGSAYFAITGPSALRTYTFPNADATVLTTGTAITPAQGGTGITSYTIGDLIYASGATTLAKLADASTGNALISGGVGVAPSYGKIGLTTHVTGTLPVANGGTNLTAYTIGDLIYASGTTALAALADVATGSVLVSGGVGTAPAWSASPGAVTPLTAITARLQTAWAAATATVVQVIRSTATNDDPTESVTQYRVATTDATPTALATIAVTQFTTTQIHCAITARRTGGAAGTDGDGAAYFVDVALKNESGTAAEIAAETLTVVGEDQVGWTVTAAVSGGNEVLSVTGAVDNNVTWHATCRTYAVGS